MRWRDFDGLPPLPDSFFATPRRVHFVGVGGIGMSGLARVLADRGHHVSGSDARESAMLQKLRDEGIRCAVGHGPENLKLWGDEAEAVIWGSAIAGDNPEREAAEKLGVPQWHRAQLLAYFVNNARHSIAVSGTHGKSTTSAMIAHILTECGKNPTAILGAEYPPFGSNVRLGDRDLVVVEADESDGSFTLLKPSVAVVTNVEPEHLENYDDSEEELWRAFEMFVDGAGHRLLNANDERLCQRISHGDLNLFGVEAVPSVVTARDVHIEPGKITFSCCYGEEQEASLLVPGMHNVANGMGAIAAAGCTMEAELEVGDEPPDEETLEQLLDIAPSCIEALKSFSGIARRFEFKGEANGVAVYDDYGHHPTEVRATLEATRDFLQRPVVLIFQPHRYSRTQQMGHEFGPSFEAADRVVVTELYSAFETPIAGVSGRIVFDSLTQSFPDKPAQFAATLDDALQMALQWAKPGDAILTMGAGDVGTLGLRLLQALRQRETA